MRASNRLVFPARAGMNRRPEHVDPRRVGVPRASGDEPATLFGEPFHSRCSPRERG